MTNEKKKKFLIYVAYSLVLLGLLYFALKFCLSYLLPFIIGTIIAIGVQRPASLLSERISIKKGILALILVISIYLALVLILFFVGSRIYIAAADFTNKAPQIFEKVTIMAKSVTEKIQGFTGNISGEYGGYVSTAVNNFIENTVSKVSDYISSFFTQFAASVPGMIFSIFVTIITGCYIAKDFEVLKNNLKFALKPDYITNIRKIWVITTNNVFKILKGYIILALIAFVQLLIGFLILRIDGAAKTALLIAFVDILPVFGSGTVLIPWAIISAFNGRFTLTVGLVIIYAVITIVRNIAEPKIVGRQVGLHPLLTLASMFLGVKIFGFWGLFLLPLIVTVGYHYAAEKVTENSYQHSM